MTKEIRRVLRGASWSFSARFCRSAIRFRYESGDRYYNLGFRPAFRLLQKQLRPETSNAKNSAQI